VVFQNRVFGPLPEDLVGEEVRVRVVDNTLQVRVGPRVLAIYPLAEAPPAADELLAVDEEVASNT
jgi:hypothetical protein